MLDGFSYLVGEIALLLLLGVAVGVLGGRFLWPRGRRGTVASPPAPAEAEASVRLEVAETKLVAAETKLAETRRKLSEAHAEVLRMSSRSKAMADQTEVAMGRLESGAIAALESTIDKHRAQVAGLELRLRTAEESARSQSHQLDAERRRGEQLKAALVERDEHLASLLSGEPERRR